MPGDMKEKGGLMAMMGMGSSESPKGGGSEFDADAKMLKSALDSGNGRRAYEVVKGWVEKCLSERESKDEEPDEGMY